MYIWKFKNLGLKNQKKASKIIGVSSVYLSNICSRKVNIKKRLAYFIVKFIDENAEIDDYFERID